MKLYVIRHGETNMGKKELIATEEEPLNENGIIQAKKIGEDLRKLDIHTIYCSPIERAKHTLELFNLDKNIPFKNLDWNIFWNYNSDLKYPELETMKSVYERVKEFINEIKLQNKNVLLVTHGGISRAIYWYFNGIPKNGNSSNINENCKIYEYDL